MGSARPQSRGRSITAFVAVATAMTLIAGCGDGRPVTQTAQAPAPGLRRGPGIASTVDSAVFTVDCLYSHQANDDPIVHPRQPGASHLHNFFGASGTDAFSTAASLRGGDTSCEDRDDTAAYWAPALLDGDKAVRPDFLRAYYRAAIGVDARTVRVLPPGLELISGNSHAMTGQWTPTRYAGWGCGFRPKRLHRVPPTDCTVNSPVTLRLVFPDCWDGRNLASADHQSHVARSREGRCPPSHPVAILQVQVSIQYPIWKPTQVAPSTRAADLILASGGWQSTHGDLVNSWVQTRLEHQADLCIRALANCTIG